MKKIILSLYMLLVLLPPAIRANEMDEDDADDDDAEEEGAGGVGSGGGEGGQGTDEKEDPQGSSPAFAIAFQLPLANLSYTESMIDDHKEVFSKQSIGELDEIYVMLETSYLNIYFYPFQDETKLISLSKYFHVQTFELGLDLGMDRSTKAGEKSQELMGGLWLTYFTAIQSYMIELNLSYGNIRSKVDTLNEDEELYERVSSSWTGQLSASLIWLEYSDNLHFLSKMAILRRDHQNEENDERIWKVELIPVGVRVLL